MKLAIDEIGVTKFNNVRIYPPFFIPKMLNTAKGKHVNVPPRHKKIQDINNIYNYALYRKLQIKYPLTNYIHKIK